jgi:GT2 family glycosyltransferase
MGEITPRQENGSFIALSLPPTSLIICSRNRPKLLAEVVASILQGDALPTEIIIIDDSDSRHEVLSSQIRDRTCELRYVWTHSRGLSRANNDGIAAARYDILVFAQDDMLVAPTWFGHIVKALIEAGKRSVVTGRVLPGEVEASGGFAPSTKSDESPAVYQGRIGIDVLFLQNMAMYRSAPDEVGLFDGRLGPGSRFPTAEDNDFALRLLEAGYRIFYVPQAIVYHRAWRAECDYLPLCWNYGRGQGAYYAKYLSLRDRYMLRRMVSDIVRHVLLIPHRVWWREPRRAGGDVVYILALISGVIEWILTQRRTR